MSFGVLSPLDGVSLYSSKFNRYVVSTDVAFFDWEPFFSAISTSISQKEEDEWLIYKLTSDSGISSSVSSPAQSDDGGPTGAQVFASVN